MHKRRSLEINNIWFMVTPLIMLLAVIPVPVCATDSTSLTPPSSSKNMRLISQTFTTLPPLQDNLLYPTNTPQAIYTTPRIPSNWTCKSAFKMTPIMKGSVYPVCVLVRLKKSSDWGDYTLQTWGMHETKYVYSNGGKCHLITSGSSKIAEINNVVRGGGATYVQTGGNPGYPPVVTEDCSCNAPPPPVPGYRGNFSGSSWVSTTLPAQGELVSDIYSIICEQWVSN